MSSDTSNWTGNVTASLPPERKLYALFSDMESNDKQQKQKTLKIYVKLHKMVVVKFSDVSSWVVSMQMEEAWSVISIDQWSVNQRLPHYRTRKFQIFLTISYC